MLALLAATVLTAAQTGWVTPIEAHQGFKAMNLDRWREWRGSGVPSDWHLDGSDLQLTPGRQGGDLESIDQFVNFDLRLDWNISEGGNSGVIYRSTELGEACWQTGPEFQLLDNERNGDGRNPLTSAGSAYDVYAPTSNATHPAGQWNSIRIVARGHHVEHWMNGVKVVDYELSSPDWTRLVAASKFNAYPRYGLEPVGHIVLQDHGYAIRFRNIRIKRL